MVAFTHPGPWYLGFALYVQRGRHAPMLKSHREMGRHVKGAEKFDDICESTFVSYYQVAAGSGHALILSSLAMRFTMQLHG